MSRIEPLLEQVVAGLSHRRANVRCWSTAGWKQEAEEWARRWPQLGPLGHWRGYTVPGPRPSVNLSPSICTELIKLADRPQPVWEDEWPDALAWSAAMLAHEAQHVSGIRDEVRAECYGMQSIQAAAVALGRTPQEGQYLAALYWKRSYPREGPVYRSRDCRNGGALDLRPDAGVWP